jgi:hypothetical protein
MRSPEPRQSARPIEMRYREAGSHSLKIRAVTKGMIIAKPVYWMSTPR